MVFTSYLVLWPNDQFHLPLGIDAPDVKIQSRRSQKHWTSRIRNVAHQSGASFC